MSNYDATIEDDIMRYLHRADHLDLKILDKLSELETHYMKVKWAVLSKLIPKFIFEMGYSLEASLDINDPSNVYLFNDRTIKEINIDFEKMIIVTKSIDGINSATIEIVDLEELLFIDKEGILYELTDVLNYLLDEHVMPTQTEIKDNIIEVNFKTKKLM